MQKISTDVLYFQNSAENAVTHRVKLGETFEVQTQLNSGPWIDQLPPQEQALLRHKLAGGNPASGCIFVEGVKEGGGLSVEIGEFALDQIGYTSFSGNNGAMP